MAATAMAVPRQATTTAGGKSPQARSDQHLRPYGGQTLLEPLFFQGVVHCEAENMHPGLGRVRMLLMEAYLNPMHYNLTEFNSF